MDYKSLGKAYLEIRLNQQQKSQPKVFLETKVKKQSGVKIQTNLEGHYLDKVPLPVHFLLKKAKKYMQSLVLFSAATLPLHQKYSVHHQNHQEVNQQVVMAQEAVSDILLKDTSLLISTIISRITHPFLN